MTILRETELNTSEFDVDEDEPECHDFMDGRTLCGKGDGGTFRGNHSVAECEAEGHRVCLDCQWIYQEMIRGYDY